MKKKLSILFAIFAVIFCLAASATFFPDIIVTSPNGIWTDTRAYTNLSTAITAIGANDRDVYIVREETVTTLTIPANVRLHFLKTGAIANSDTLAINTRNIHADHQIFTGAGAVNFISGSEVRTRWFEDFETAITQTSNDTVTLTVDTADTLANSAAVGDNVLLRWNSLNLITIAGGQTLSNIGDISAPDIRLFVVSGSIAFKTSSPLTAVRACWLGSTLATLDIADNAAYAAGKPLVITPGVWVIDDNVTLASNAKVLQNVDLQIAIAKTLTFTYPIEAGLYQVFSCTGTGVVVFEQPTIMSPEWWGAVGDNVTDDIIPITQTIACANTSAKGGVVKLNSVYYVSDTVSFNLNRGTYDVVGIGKKLCGFRSEADGYPAVEILGTKECIFKSFGIIGGTGTVPTTADNTPSVAILQGRCVGGTGTGSYQLEDLWITGSFQYGEIYNLSDGVVDYINITALTYVPADNPAGVVGPKNKRRFAIGFAGLEDPIGIVGRNATVYTTYGMGTVRINRCAFSLYGDNTLPDDSCAAYLHNASGINFSDVAFGRQTNLGSEGTDVFTLIDSYGCDFNKLTIESTHRYTFNISVAGAVVKELKHINVTNFNTSAVSEAFISTNAYTRLANCHFYTGGSTAGKIVLGGGAQDSTFKAPSGFQSFKVLSGYFRNNYVELGYITSTYDVSGCGAGYVYNNTIKDLRAAAGTGGQTMFDGNLRVGQSDGATERNLYLGTHKICFAAAIPATSNTHWSQGDIIFNTAATTGAPSAWQCILPNSIGTLTGVTGTILTASTRLSVLTTSTYFVIGAWIDIAGVTGPLRVNNIVYRNLGIRALSRANPCVMTELNHGLSDGDVITFTAPTQDVEWATLTGVMYAKVVDADNIRLYTDQALTTPFDSSGFADAYVPDIIGTLSNGSFFYRVAILSGAADASVEGVAVSYHNELTASAFKPLANLP